MAKFDTREWTRLLQSLIGSYATVSGVKQRNRISEERNQREKERHDAYMRRMEPKPAPEQTLSEKFKEIGASDQTKLEVLGRVQRHGGDWDAMIEEVRKEMQGLANPDQLDSPIDVGGSGGDPEQLQRVLYASQLMRGRVGSFFDGVHGRMAAGNTGNGGDAGFFNPMGQYQQMAGNQDAMPEAFAAGRMESADPPSRASAVMNHAAQQMNIAEVFAQQMRPSNPADRKSMALVDQAHQVMTDPNSDDRDKAIALQAVKDVIPTSRSVYFDSLLDQPTNFDPAAVDEMQQWFGPSDPAHAYVQHSQQKGGSWKGSDATRSRQPDPVIWGWLQDELRRKFQEGRFGVQ